jgi:hypothetical protein
MRAFVSALLIASVVMIVSAGCAKKNAVQTDVLKFSKYPVGAKLEFPY